jgi:hypothetical protein
MRGVERIPLPRPSQNWNLPTIEEAVDQYSREVRTVFHQIAAVCPVGLFGTGGLDSRTVLAGLLDQDADVRVMYGTGNSRLTDFHERDLSLAEQVAQHCGVPFERLDWSGTQPHSDEALKALFAEYGFQSEIYGAPQAFLSTFKGGLSPYPAVMVGGYSPAFTNAKPWEGEDSKVPFESLVADAMHFQGGYVTDSRCISDKKSYRRVVTEGIRTALAVNGILYPEDGAPLETFVKAKLLLYVRAEARFLNFVNEFGYYVAPFMIKRLYEPLIDVPFKFRRGDEFQLRLIKMLTPQLVEIALYSGWQSASIDATSLRFVRDTVAPLGSRWKRVLKRAILTSLRQELKGVLRKMRKPAAHPADMNTAIQVTYGGRVMRDPLGRMWFSSTAEFSPKDLARICQYLAGVNKLRYTV